MPFTLAHPAAILPLRRLRFLHTLPLVIGSLVPDVPYYLPVPVNRMFSDTHTLYGSVAVDIPLGVALLVLVLLLREPLTVLLSAQARALCLRSIDRFLARPLHWPIALASILLGAWTHIAWDSFTHPMGWTTVRVAALSSPVSVFGWDTEASHLLQYVSSVFGLIVLGLWARWLVGRAHAPRSGAPDEGARWLVLVMIGAAAVLTGVIRALLIWHFGTWYHLAYLLLTRTISWFTILYVAAGFAVLLNRIQPVTADAGPPPGAG